MLTEKCSVTVKDVDDALDELHKKYLASKRVIKDRLPYLMDAKAGQGFLVQFAPTPQDGMDIATWELLLKDLDEVNSTRKRHLTALKRVLEDEAKEIADKAQANMFSGSAIDGETA